MMEESSKFLVVGSKGSGKTYLANYICRQEKADRYCNIVSGKGFLVEKLSELSGKEMESGYMYAFCSWYIYKTIAETLMKIHPKESIIPFTHLRRLKKFYDEYNTNNDIFKIVHKTISDESMRERKKADGLGVEVEKKGTYNLD